MNAHDPDFAGADLAKLHYGDGDFAVLKPGRYVVCAVSGKKVPLEQLRYWSAPLQEAYAGPAEALQRWLDSPGGGSLWGGSLRGGAALPCRAVRLPRLGAGGAGRRRAVGGSPVDAGFGRRGALG